MRGLVAVLFIGVMIYQTPGAHRLSLIALSLLLGGAIGNTVDRIRMGEVIDFLDFYIGPYHWPAFNVVDSAITIGVGLLMLQFFWRREGAYKEDDVLNQVEEVLTDLWSRLKFWIYLPFIPSLQRRGA